MTNLPEIFQAGSFDEYNRRTCSRFFEPARAGSFDERRTFAEPARLPHCCKLKITTSATQQHLQHNNMHSINLNMKGRVPESRVAPTGWYWSGWSATGRLRSATNQIHTSVGRLRSAKVGDQLEIFPVGRRPVGQSRRPTWEVRQLVADRSATVADQPLQYQPLGARQRRVCDLLGPVATRRLHDQRWAAIFWVRSRPVICNGVSRVPYGRKALI